MQFKGMYRFILSLFIMILCQHNGRTAVTLTVEDGVSLVGPLCPGTVRLFCEGVGLHTLGWSYNGDTKNNTIIDRVNIDDDDTLFPIISTNPAFVSATVNITNTNRNLFQPQADFSSVLTVNLVELNKQDIKNITCGDLNDIDTLKIVDYFTPNITAVYQVGILNKIEVKWQLPCPDYNVTSYIYKINLTDTKMVQLNSRDCVNRTCYVAFTQFSINIMKYELTVLRTTCTNNTHNINNMLDKFKLTIAYLRKNYFVWNVTSIICHMYSVQFEAVTNSTFCSIQHSTSHNHDIIFSCPLKSQISIPYINPGTAHHFFFSAMIKDYFYIMDRITTIEPSIIDYKGIFILLFTSLFLCLGLIHLFVHLLSAFCKATVLSSNKELYTISTIVLLVLTFSCVALLIAFGIFIKGDHVCNSRQLIPMSLLDAMIVVSSLGIMLVAVTWFLLGYRFYKHKTGKFYKEDGHSSKQQTNNNELAQSTCTTASNCNYFSHEPYPNTTGSRQFDETKIEDLEQVNYDTLEHPGAEHLVKVKQENSKHKQCIYTHLNKETMLADPNEAGHYMPLRAGERSKPVPNLTDDSYSYVGRTSSGPTIPNAGNNHREENKRENYDILESLQVSTKPATSRPTIDSMYQEIDLADVNFEPGEVYTQLRPGEKSKPVPNFDDPCYAHIYSANNDEQNEIAKKPTKFQKRN